MVITIIGLFFGDEGKGHTTAYLTEKYNVTASIRFSGGSQAAHRVVKKGIPHIFAQFGSGNSVSKVTTFLTDQMVIDPFALLEEAFIHRKRGLGNLLERLFIDDNCTVVHAYNKSLNRAEELNREIMGQERRSTTGMGVGQTFQDLRINKTTLKVKDLLNEQKISEKLMFILNEKTRQFLQLDTKVWSEFSNGLDVSLKEYIKRLRELGKILGKNYSCILPHEIFNEKLLTAMRTENVIFEGSQGTLLDRRFGKNPYITNSNVSLRSAERKIDELGYKGKCFNIGVMRGYITRHGLGPLPTETEEIALQIDHNCYNNWQGHFRRGWLDLPLLDYSIRCNNHSKQKHHHLDGIILTNMDNVPPDGFYRPITKNEMDLWDFDSFYCCKRANIEELIENTTKLPILAESWGEENCWLQKKKLEK